MLNQKECKDNLSRIGKYFQHNPPEGCPFMGELVDDDFCCGIGGNCNNRHKELECWKRYWEMIAPELKYKRD